MSRPPSKPPQNNFELAKNFFLLGLESYHKELFEDAERYLFLSLNLLPDRLNTLTNLSAVLIKLDKLEKANKIISNAISLYPTNETLYLNQGLIYGQNKNWQMALSSYNKAIELKPDYAEAYSNRGNVLNELKRFEEALLSFDKAIELKSDYAEAYYNSGIVFHELNRFDEELASYDKAISYKNDYAEAYYNKSLLLLAIRDFENGWLLYDWRWENKSLGFPKLSTTKPKLVNLEPNYVKKILIWAEQGIGDQVLYSSMLDKLLSIAPSSQIMIDKRLLPLLQRSFKKGKFLDSTTVIKNIEFDEHSPIGDLGKFFRTSSTDFDFSRKNYLLADSLRAKEIRADLIKNKKFLCGITWNSETEKIGAEKSIELEDLLPLINIDHIAFVSLQYGDVKEQIINFNKKNNLFLQECLTVDNFYDLDGHAALIEACDFVITISNTTAHMAGAIGKETYLMCPYGKGLLWYWSNQKNGSSLWYPSIKIYKQNAPSQWLDVIQRIKLVIEKR